MIAAIIQARMSSTRLPGKVLMPLGDTTVLGQCLRRVKKVRGIGAVCVATAPGCEEIANEACRHGALVWFGSEGDVLRRYAGAAAALKANIVVRITSDCPFIDPTVVERLIKSHNWGITIARKLPHGLDCEVFDAGWLMRADRNATETYDREHVTPWIKREAPIREESFEPDPWYSSLRWTIDYPEDIEFARKALELVPDFTSYRELANALRERPDIVAINAMHSRGVDPFLSRKTDKTKDP